MGKSAAQRTFHNIIIDHGHPRFQGYAQGGVLLHLLPPQTIFEDGPDSGTVIRVAGDCDQRSHAALRRWSWRRLQSNETLVWLEVGSEELKLPEFPGFAAASSKSNGVNVYVRFPFPANIIGLPLNRKRNLFAPS